MNILVTGGSGFIGTHLIKALYKEGHKITNVDIKNMSDGHKHLIGYRYADIASSHHDLFHIFKEGQFDVCYHLAAQTSVPHSIKFPMADARSNIMGTLNIIEMCRLFDVKMVFASTAAVYGTPKELPLKEDATLNPESPYGVSKMSCEQYIKMGGIEYTILRFANVYGCDGGGVVSTFLFDAMNDIPLMINGDGSQTRDFIYVKAHKV
jgi:UDP-glucose 4-epimerase